MRAEIEAGGDQPIGLRISSAARSGQSAIISGLQLSAITSLL
jgi:hypothetical protein